PGGHSASVNATKTSTAGAPASPSRLNGLSASAGPCVTKLCARPAMPPAAARELDIRRDAPRPPPLAETYRPAPRRMALPSDVLAPRVRHPRATPSSDPTGVGCSGG